METWFLRSESPPEGRAKYRNNIPPTASLCMFLAICAQHGWTIHQLDIKSAYLNGTISKDIYMRQPVGYEEKGSEMKVAKLRKGLYRLKQAGWEWYATLHDFLVQLGFH